MLSKKLVFAVALTASSAALANGSWFNYPGPIPEWVNQAYIGVNGGYSMSRDVHLRPDFTIGSPATNFTVPENTTWDGDIDSSAFAGAYIGYRLTPTAAVQLGYDYRGNFEWRKDVNAAAQFPDDPFERYSADIKIQTVLLNVKLNPYTNWCGFVPYVMAGVGASWNKLSTIRDVNVPRDGVPVTFDIRLSGKTTTNFAWDIGVGVDYALANNFSFDLGYRLVDVGEIKSKSSFVDVVNVTSGNYSPFKSSRVLLDEVYAGLSYHFG